MQWLVNVGAKKSSASFPQSEPFLKGSDHSRAPWGLVDISAEISL